MKKWKWKTVLQVKEIRNHLFLEKKTLESPSDAFFLLTLQRSFFQRIRQNFLTHFKSLRFNLNLDTIFYGQFYGILDLKVEIHISLIFSNYSHMNIIIIRFSLLAVSKFLMITWLKIEMQEVFCSRQMVLLFLAMISSLFHVCPVCKNDWIWSTKTWMLETKSS